MIHRLDQSAHAPDLGSRDEVFGFCRLREEAMGVREEGMGCVEEWVQGLSFRIMEGNMHGAGLGLKVSS